MLSVVIALLTMAALAGSVLALRQMRRNREVNELLLRLRMRDVLLTNESLAALPIALTVHLPRAFWSPAVVGITGRVPTADLRDDVVRLAKRELSRWRTGAQTAARFVVEPLIGPREAAGTRGAASAVTPRGTRGRGPHVLIADDDRTSLDELELGGALSRPPPIAKWPWRTLALHPSLVITDFTMPRLNGLEVWQVLRRHCPETPVIILTGQGAVEPLLAAAGEGPYGYLEKPVEVPQLRMLVAKALAPETGTVSSRASRGLARPKPPASQTPLPERPIWRMSQRRVNPGRACCAAAPRSEQMAFVTGRRPQMSTPVHKGIMESVKDTLVGSIKGTGEIVTTVVDTVSGTLVSTIKSTGAVGTALTSTVSDVLRGAITGTAQVGGDLGATAKGGVIGVLKGTKEVGAEAVGTISTSARVLVKSAAEVGGDVGLVARNAVEGAIAGAKSVGLGAEEAASAAATGALKGAGEISQEAVEQVQRAVTGVIAGVKVVVKEPFK